MSQEAITPPIQEAVASSSHVRLSVSDIEQRKQRERERERERER